MSDRSPMQPAIDPDTASEAARRRAVWGLVVAATVAGLFTVNVVAGMHIPDGLDKVITDWVRAWADPLGWPVDLAHVIGILTSPVASSLTGGVFILVLAATRYFAAAGLLAISCVTGVLVSEVMKRAVGRTRPPGAEQFEDDLTQSFPSGHSMVGIFMYLASGLVLIRLGRHQDRDWMQIVGRALVILGPFIGLTRLVLGVHWPSDIVAGWAFGSVVLLVPALILWWPLHRGWDHARPATVAPPVPPGGAPPITPPAPPAAGSTPAAPAA